MRTIKFKAWNGEKMIDPLSVFMPYDGEINHTNGGFTLMQFTGLLDKNGKEIFEGDKVIGTFTYAEICLVIWDEKRCGFYLKPIEGFAASDKYLKMNACKLEIIGNIYENQELLG